MYNLGPLGASPGGKHAIHETHFKNLKYLFYMGLAFTFVVPILICSRTLVCLWTMNEYQPQNLLYGVGKHGCCKPLYVIMEL